MPLLLVLQAGSLSAHTMMPISPSSARPLPTPHFSPSAQICDFGLATDLEDPGWAFGGGGTYQCMSPEQMRACRMVARGEPVDVSSQTPFFPAHLSMPACS